MKFRKKPILIEAEQWFKNGDHSLDNCEIILDQSGHAFKGEGKLVRKYNVPLIDGKKLCEHCHFFMYNHGWIETLEGGHIVCPGDWIIEGIAGEHYPCKPAIFDKTYERVFEDNEDNFIMEENIEDIYDKQND